MDIIEKIKRYPKILIGSPVYCDFPSPKLLAFLSRLAVLSEGMKRKPFKNKWIYIHTNGFCSGTKSAAKIIMDACEMIGFKHKGRCISEYIELWKDNKIRGGF
jgi:multimeric flavodoxin WrbA